MSAIFNLDFYSGNDTYCDQNETIILQDLKKGLSPEEILQRHINEEDPILRYMYYYHFARDRLNVLSWYDFKKDAELLEVGAGCGAMTSLFAEKCRHVTSVDLSKQRCEINYERNKKYDNLEICAANLNDLNLTKKFDYITVIGVLEYSGEYTNSANPYTDFLKNIKAYLKEDGILIVAIENRLGLKYFNGALEDHFLRPFIGINNYIEAPRHIKTFSRNEICDLFEQSGYNMMDLYLAHPDYKHASNIVHESAHQFHNLTVCASPNYSLFPSELYSETVAMDTITKEGIYAHFGNSFLAFLRSKNT